MAENDKSGSNRQELGRLNRVYKDGYQPENQRGHQPITQTAERKPPSNPPNQGSAGKKQG